MTTTAISYVAIPILLEWVDASVSFEFTEGLTLLRGGAVRIDNRIYRRHQPIRVVTNKRIVTADRQACDVSIVRAARNRKSDLLRIRTGVNLHRELLFFYRYRLFKGYCWVNLVRQF